MTVACSPVSVPSRAPRGARRGLSRLFAVLVVLCAASGIAHAQMDITPLNATRTVTTVTGDVIEQFSFCAESFEEAPDKKSSTPIPYGVTVSIGGAATPFTLQNGTGQTLPVSVVWQDTVANTLTTLAPASPTPMTLSGKISGCPGGNNAVLILTVANADIGTAVSGTYTRSFSVRVENNGSGRRSRTATVTLSVVVSSIIKISNVSDMVLGTFDGINDLVASDTLCIYKNGTFLYGITATGSGAGGAFTLTNGSGTLPYTVSWQDTLGTVALSAGVQANGRGNAYTLNPTCSGGSADNVTVTVRAIAAALMATPGGASYSGVLSLIVAAQ